MLSNTPYHAVRGPRTEPASSVQERGTGAGVRPTERRSERRVDRDRDRYDRPRDGHRTPPAGSAPAVAKPVAEPSPRRAGDLPISPASSFDELRLRPATRAAVAAMGISVPTPIQAQAIPVMLEGRDVVGQARTGSGKTLAFGLPIVERCDPTVRGVQALVLVPTRELAIQVGDVLGRLAAARGLRLTLLYGGRSLLPEARALAVGAQIVVGTPGRTLDHLRQRKLSLQQLRVFVLDEGDEMLDRGFAPDVERILSHAPSNRQTALFSATVPAWVVDTAARHLRAPVTVRVDPTETPPEIEHVVYEVDPSARLAVLRTLLDRRGAGPILVFGRTKHGVKKLARQLDALGYPVGALQGNLSQNARERVMAEFRSGALPILLATNVAARGLDIDGIEQVINFELPESAELFTHRAGRTGRMGRQGEAITLITPDDAAKWRQIERALGRTLPREPWADGATPASSRPETAPTPLRSSPPPSARPDTTRRRVDGWRRRRWSGAGAAR
jgi:ATP-dependent RNA helicase DeaD